MKDKNVSHNDIKPGNLLLNMEPTDDDDVEMKLKIGDLGMGGITGGTPGWVAPEFMHGAIAGLKLDVNVLESSI